MESLKQDEFLKSLRLDFKIEADEHIQAITQHLTEMERHPETAMESIRLETIFREVHSLKGASRAVNLIQLEQLSMSMESVFQLIKQGKLQLAPVMYDTFYQCLDVVQQVIDQISEHNTEVGDVPISGLLDKLRAMTNRNETQKVPLFSLLDEEPSFLKIQPVKNEPVAVLIDEIEKKPETEKQPSAPPQEAVKSTIAEKSTEKETVRVPVHRLFDLMDQAQEMITYKAVLNFHLQQLEQNIQQLHQYRQNLTNTPNSSQTKNNLSEEGRNQFLAKHEYNLSRLQHDLSEVTINSARAVDNLLYDIRRTLLFPVSMLFSVVPRIIRDLAKACDKTITYAITGEETEIDRRILDELKDPVIHLIRNSVDHGVETKAERLAAGKQENGQISVVIVKRPDQKIMLSISDDGRGINTEKVAAAALQAGIITNNELERLTESEKNMLIFGSGVSTSKLVTDISGRGLGMAIVAEKVSALGGELEIESKPGKGTTFHIIVPQTLSVFRGILVKSAGQLFMIPTNAVVSAIQLRNEDVKTVESKQVSLFQGKMLPVVALQQLLKIRQFQPSNQQTHQKALIISVAGKSLILTADEVIGEFEGVVKPLSPQLKHVKMIAGATMLGDGKIVPVIQVSELLDEASEHAHSIVETVASQNTKERAKRKILMAEDSITVRNMLRNILESNGFDVKTAVDGFDGYEQLVAGHYDLVVSDVEMPRINGFEFTSKIRQHPVYKHLPVILVTALESAEDRRKGMEAGANAYIVKGSFDKNNLIETINHLI